MIDGEEVQLENSKMVKEGNHRDLFEQRAYSSVVGHRLQRWLKGSIGLLLECGTIFRQFKS